MSINFEEFPGLRRTALCLSYANGGINRERSEELALVEQGIELTNYIDDSVPLIIDRLKVIDKFLFALSDGELDMLCDGSEDDREMILGRLEDPILATEVDDLLECMFEAC